jgi:hypothetical protein
MWLSKVTTRCELPLVMISRVPVLVEMKTKKHGMEIRQARAGRFNSTRAFAT